MPNAFSANGGAFTYLLDTSVGALPGKRLYRFTASWNDGTQSVGYLYLRL